MIELLESIPRDTRMAVCLVGVASLAAIATTEILYQINREVMSKLRFNRERLQAQKEMQERARRGFGMRKRIS